MAAWAAWQVDPQSGRPFYVNHETKQTTWDDPRGQSPPPGYTPQPGYPPPAGYPQQPMAGYPQQPMAQPMMGQPMMGQPPMGQPPMGAPVAAGQPVPAPMPQSPPPASLTGAPPGLEHLAYMDKVLIKQQVELLEAFTGFETNNKYHILNPLGQQIFYAKEGAPPPCRRTVALDLLLTAPWNRH